MVGERTNANTCQLASGPHGKDVNVAVFGPIVVPNEYIIFAIVDGVHMPTRILDGPRRFPWIHNSQHVYTDVTAICEQLLKEEKNLAIVMQQRVPSAQSADVIVLESVWSEEG